MDGKAEYVQELWTFYKEKCGNIEGFKKMVYLHENHGEWIYIEYGGGSQKRFSVWGDNPQGILKDFVRFLNDHDDLGRYPWLNGPMRREI